MNGIGSGDHRKMTVDNRVVPICASVQAGTDPPIAHIFACDPKLVLLQQFAESVAQPVAGIVANPSRRVNRFRYSAAVLNLKLVQ